jgi:hypothetical protein
MSSETFSSDTSPTDTGTTSSQKKLTEIQGKLNNRLIFHYLNPKIEFTFFVNIINNIIFISIHILGVY